MPSDLGVASERALVSVVGGMGEGQGEEPQVLDGGRAVKRGGSKVSSLCVLPVPQQGVSLHSHLRHDLTLYSVPELLTRPRNSGKGLGNLPQECFECCCPCVVP